jgi:hypothetical protein
MANGSAALQLLATQHYGKAGKALQLATMARPAERCSSLLWRGWQSVATRCCGNGQQRVTALATFLFFFFYSTTSREKERDRQKEKGKESL